MSTQTNQDAQERALKIQQAKALREQGLFYREIGAELGVSEKTAERLAKSSLENLIEEQLQSRAADNLELTMSTVTEDGKNFFTDPSEILEEHGFDTDQYVVDSLKVKSAEKTNALGDMEHTSTVTAVFKPTVSADDLPEVIFNRPNINLKARERSQHYGGEKLWVFTSDQHAGAHEDPVAHELVCKFISSVEPHHFAILGDLLDYNSISRFSPKLDVWTAGVDECIKTAQGMLNDYVSSLSEDAECYYLHGNHEDRMMNYINAKAPHLAKLRDPSSGYSIFSERFLLNFDALGFKQVGDVYPYGRLEIVPDELYAIHGHKTGPRSGAAALKHGERTTHSLLLGHTHSQSMMYRTLYEGVSPKTQTIAEIGHLSSPSWEGHGYAPENNWQQGGATVSVHSDGSYHIEHFTIRDKALFWRGERWTI